MGMMNLSGDGGEIVGTYGTFTPVILAGGVQLGQTYVDQVGSYYRIGRVINFTLNLSISAKTAAAGVITISGMPDFAENRDYVTMIYAHGISIAADQRPKALLLGTHNYLSLYAVTAAGVNTALVDTNIAANANFTVTGAYLTNI